MQSLEPVSLLAEGKIAKIRGIAYSTRVPPAMGNRMADAARTKLKEVRRWRA
mgnify:CR=1 FL=1